MRVSNVYAAPAWVRCVICVIASTCVPALIFATCLGVDVNPYLTVVVGVFAVRATSLAFNSTGLIVRKAPRRREHVT